MEVSCWLCNFIASGGKLSTAKESLIKKAALAESFKFAWVQYERNHPYLPAWFNPFRVFHTPPPLTPFPKGHQPHNGPPHQVVDLVLGGRVFGVPCLSVNFRVFL